MDILQEGSGLPAAKFLDGLGICTIQVEGHGSPRSQRVATDVGGFIASSVESNLPCGLFQKLVDVGGSDCPVTGVEWMFDTVDGCVRGATIRENVVHSSSQGFDWTVHCLGAVLGDALTLGAILLARNDNRGCCGLVELTQRRSVGDDMLALPKGHILHSKRNGVASSTSSGWSVLPNPQQVVKCNVAQVSLGFPVGAMTMVSCVVPMGVKQVSQQSDWDGKLGQCWRVVTFVATQHVL